MMYELKFLEANVCMIYITLYSVGCGRGGTMDPSLSLSMGINGGVWFLAREKTWRGGGVCGSWPGKKLGEVEKDRHQIIQQYHTAMVPCPYLNTL